MDVEREDWKSRLNKTIYFLEVLENRFPYWTLPLDLELVTMEGSKIEHKMDWEELKDALCETGLIEQRRHTINIHTGEKIKSPFPIFKFRISPKGLNFLNNIRVKNLSRNIFWLTLLILLFGLIQISFIILSYYL